MSQCYFFLEQDGSRGFRKVQNKKYSFLSIWLAPSPLLYISSCCIQRWIPWLQNKLIKFQFSELQATAIFLWSIKLSWSEIIKPLYFTNPSFWEEEFHRRVLTPLSPLQDQSPSQFSTVPDDFFSHIQLAQAFLINVTNNWINCLNFLPCGRFSSRSISILWVVQLCTLSSFRWVLKVLFDWELQASYSMQ